MDFKRTVNRYRRTLMQKMTRNVGTSYAHNPTAINANEIKHILISRPNHRLGNLLLMTPLVQEISALFPNATIDLFIKGGLGTAVFKTYPNLHLIQLPKKPFRNPADYINGWLRTRQTRYDFAINVINGSSSGRLSVQFSNAKRKFFGDDTDGLSSKYPDYQHMAKQPVYYFRHCLVKMGLTVNEIPVPTLNLKLTPTEISEGKTKLRAVTGNHKRVICLFTNATGDKCYSAEWWTDFYERIQKEFPEFNIIELLPVENTSRIDFKAPTYSNKDIREVGSVLANVDLFIGADSGVMHLAGAVNAPTLGFFSVTDEKSYEPYNGKSVGLNTNHTTTEDYIRTMHYLLY